MRIFSRSVLRAFWTIHADAEAPLKAWYDDVEKANWRSPHAVKSRYANASVLPDNRVVFNIRGNDYRVVVKIHYNTQFVYIRFIGTHHDYDAIDAETI